MSYDNIPQMASLETPLTSVGVPIDQLAHKWSILCCLLFVSRAQYH
ncbi:hypothetical protein PO124_12925 [Bacillus licheniformis]|nr:hypothetical protein [Bacillus licheniformis]